MLRRKSDMSPSAQCRLLRAPVKANCIAVRDSNAFQESPHSPDLILDMEQMHQAYQLRITGNLVKQESYDSPLQTKEAHKRDFKSIYQESTEYSTKRKSFEKVTASKFLFKEFMEEEEAERRHCLRPLENAESDFQMASAGCTDFWSGLGKIEQQPV